MNWLPVAAVVGVVSVVVWRTIGRTMLTVALLASEFAVGLRLELLENTTARLDNVRTGEVVRWRDDLLVAFSGGAETWIRRDSRGRVVVEDADGTISRLRLPHLARNARTRRLRIEWAKTPRPLTAIVTCDGAVALVRRQALLGEHATASK
jgi:hypothetical protein